MVRVDFAFDQVACFEIGHGRGHIASVDTSVAAKVCLARGPRLVESGEEAVVVSPQPFAVLGEPSSEKGGRARRCLAQQPRGAQPEPIRGTTRLGVLVHVQSVCQL